MKTFFAMFLGLILFISCSKSDELKAEHGATLENPKWNITEPPFPVGAESPYPLMNTPQFKNVNEVKNLNDEHKVAIVSFEGVIKVYPYLYNDTYEIVNDRINKNYYAVSYCPQTKSAINYNRIVKNDTLDLIASGYLYKENMVPSDTKFNYFWSQMLMKGINNAAVSQDIRTFNLVQTTWKTIKTFFPTAKVFVHDNLVIPTQKTGREVTTIANDDVDDVFGIIENFNNEIKNEVVRSFAFNQFPNEVTIKEISFEGKNVLIIGSKKNYFFSAYIIPPDITFNNVDKNVFPPILRDHQGNTWNVFGYATEGPKKGAQLDSPKSYVAAWWAWKLFYSNIKIE